MELLFVIAQGAGLAAACGVRPFLPALLAGALAAGDVRLDFDATSYAFLEGVPVLAGVAAGAVALTFLEARRRAPLLGAGPLAAALGGIGIGLGALLFAAGLAEGGWPAWPGLIAGLGCAALAQLAARQVFAPAAARLGEGERRALVVYLEGAALALAALAVVFSPLALLALVALAVLVVRGRRRAGGKHAGLRVLR